MWPFSRSKRAEPATEVPARRQSRRFDGAAINRLTASFMGESRSIDDVLRGDLDKLRQRCRDMADNNPYVRKFVRMVARNVVGPSGFVLQARVMDAPDKPDNLANGAIELAFYQWSRRGVCEITGRQSFPDLCRAIAMAVARDGEALVRIVRGKAAENGYGLALQQLDITRLDTTMNAAPIKGRNAIIMGIEVDIYSRPVAYWLRSGASVNTQASERIPAADILHLFISERPEQTRGLPWMHASMLQLHNLKGYQEAAIIAARVGAAKMGFFTTPDGRPTGVGDEDEESGEFITDAEAGTFGVLPTGYDFKSFDPDYPHQLYADFVKASLRSVASGFDVAYNSLANDLEGVNFSSIRAGVLEERDQWMTLQNWFIDAFLEPVFDEWLRLAMLNKMITMPNGSPLPFIKLDKFSAHVWQGRRWSWVDPQKDIEAARLTIKSGIASPQSIAAQMGMDIEDVLDDIAAFEAQLKAKQVTLVDYDISTPAAAPPVKDLP